MTKSSGKDGFYMILKILQCANSVGALVDGDRTLSIWPHCQTRDTEVGSLLLNTTGVCNSSQPIFGLRYRRLVIGTVYCLLTSVL